MTREEASLRGKRVSQWVEEYRRETAGMLLKRAVGGNRGVRVVGLGLVMTRLYGERKKRIFVCPRWIADGQDFYRELPCNLDQADEWITSRLAREESLVCDRKRCWRCNDYRYGHLIEEFKGYQESGTKSSGLWQEGGGSFPACREPVAALAAAPVRSNLRRF